MSYSIYSAKQLIGKHLATNINEKLLKLQINPSNSHNKKWLVLLRHYLFNICIIHIKHHKYGHFSKRTYFKLLYEDFYERENEILGKLKSNISHHDYMKFRIKIKEFLDEFCTILSNRTYDVDTIDDLLKKHLKIKSPLLM